MKLRDLEPFVEPPRVRQACAACQTMAPECLVPMGDGALPMCWLCAHHVVEHGIDVSAAHCAECECLPQDIYPNRGPGDIVAKKEEAPQEPPVSRGDDRERLLALPHDKLVAWAREAHKQMSNGQHAAVKKRLN